MKGIFLFSAAFALVASVPGDNTPCSSTKTCAKGLFCYITDNKKQTGVCHPDNVFMDDDECYNDTNCSNSNLRCSNFNVLKVTNGINALSVCVPYWFLGSFTNTKTAAIAPSAVSYMTVSKLATVGMNAYIDVTINGPSVKNLDFVLDPTGSGYVTKFTLDSATKLGKVSRSGNILKIKDLEVVAPSDDSVNRLWTLKISNNGTEKLTLATWTLRVSSRLD